jgi:hypothetical protein
MAQKPLLWAEVVTTTTLTQSRSSPPSLFIIVFIVMTMQQQQLASTFVMSRVSLVAVANPQLCHLAVLPI